MDASNGNYASLMALRKETLVERCARENLPTNGKKHTLASRLVKAYVDSCTPVAGQSDESVEGNLADGSAHEVALAPNGQGLTSDNNIVLPNSNTMTDNGQDVAQASGRLGNRKRTENPIVKFHKSSGKRVYLSGKGGPGLRLRKPSVSFRGSSSLSSDSGGMVDKVGDTVGAGGQPPKRRVRSGRRLLGSRPGSSGGVAARQVGRSAGSDREGLSVPSPSHISLPQSCAASSSESDSSDSRSLSPPAFAGRKHDIPPKHFRRYSRRSRRKGGNVSFYRDAAQMVSGTDERSGFGRHHLPIVPDRLYHQMKKGKYIDFDTLLSSLDGLRTKKGYDISLQSHSGDVAPVVQYTPRVDSPRTVRDLPSWLRAWTVYLEITGYFHPHLLLGLIRYQGIVTRFSERFLDHAWLRYDVLFRQKVALHPSVPWEGEDSRLYHEVLLGQERSHARAPAAPKGSSSFTCYSCHAPGHTSRMCPKRVPLVKNSCFKWNSPTGCVEPACIYSHTCRLCGGGHTMFRCQSKGKR